MVAFNLSFDLAKADGLAALNAFLASRTYVVGFVPSQADVALFDALAKGPDAGKYPHVARFYSHIASFSADERSAFGASIAGVTVGGAAAGGAAPKKAAAPAKKAAPAKEDSDDDLFGSDDEDDAAAIAAAKKRAADAAAKKKAAAPKRVDRTQVILEVKPLEAGQDMKKLGDDIRKITKEGLTWGEEFRTVDVAFGIQKLVLQAVVVDDLVMIDDIIEPIEALEDQVQSVDLCTMNKL